MSEISAFAPNPSFDPETLAILNAAFVGACADIGVSANAHHSRVVIAKKVLELAKGESDPEAIRASVVAALSERR